MPPDPQNDISDWLGAVTSNVMVLPRCHTVGAPTKSPQPETIGEDVAPQPELQTTSNEADLPDSCSVRVILAVRGPNIFPGKIPAKDLPFDCEGVYSNELRVESAQLCLTFAICLSFARAKDRVY